MARSTPLQLVRRRSIADAAAGITRAPVALYVYAASKGRSPLTQCRNAADARDWAIIAELVDTEERRPQWARLQEMANVGVIEGVVTQRAAIPGGADALVALGLFVHYTPPEPTTAGAAR